MNTKFISLFVPVAAVSLFLTACQDEDFGYTAEEVRHSADIRDYAQNFIDRYGVPAANHTWGFGVMPDSETNNLTRAYVANDGATVDAQRGKWPTGLAKQVNVPGWPNFDGYYYSSQGGGSNLGSISKTAKGTPCGDVTEFEIQYVSAWFRTNYISPEDMVKMQKPIHWTDYFIQNVCQDDDQYEYKKTLSNGKTGTNGENHCGKHDSQGVKLESVYFKPFEINAEGHPESDWIAFSNFDGSNATYNPEEKSVKENNAHRMIQYLHGGGTEDFCAKHGHDYHTNWVLKELTWTEIGADNLPHERTGYYLAFDYSLNGKDSPGDGYFSNWIIKISPATFAPDPDPVPPYEVTRVMCEDLGNSFDFDFNDVVFDVKLEPGTEGYTATIELQAAGGTLPIYVGLTPKDLEDHPEYKEKLEAHYLLGEKSADKPINVDPNGSTNPVAIYRLGGLNLAHNSAYDVPVTVINNGVAYNIVNGQYPGNPAYSEGSGHSGGASTPNTTDSNVPQKIATPTSVKWMNECEFIENGYSEFANWVKGGDLESDGRTLKKYNGKLWYYNFWAPERIHEYGFEDRAPGNAIGGAGAFMGIQIELTPNTISTISDITKGVLMIAGWTEQAPIWKHLETLDDDDYFTITVVYDSDPGNGVVLPVNGVSKDALINNITKESVGTPAMYPATELRMDVIYDNEGNKIDNMNRLVGYTHKFSYKKSAAVNDSGYCDYLVLFLENQTAANVTGMYISYDHTPREGSYVLPEGTYTPFPSSAQ